MKQNQILAIAVAGCLLSTARPAGAAAFTGDFAPANWEINPSSEGSYSDVFTTPSNLELAVSPGDSGISSDLIFGCNVSQSFSLNISLTLTQNGDTGAPLGYYIVDGFSTDIPVVGSPFSVSDVLVTSSIAFELDGNSIKGKEPATLDISFTDFTPVPEPGTWTLAGGMLLAGIYLIFAVIKQVRLRRAA